MLARCISIVVRQIEMVSPCPSLSYAPTVGSETSMASVSASSLGSFVGLFTAASTIDAAVAAASSDKSLL